MKILTTSDLDYVSGGEGEGSCWSGTTYAYGICYSNVSTETYASYSSNQQNTGCSDQLTDNQYTYLAATLGVATSAVPNRLAQIGMSAVGAYFTYCATPQ